MVTGQYAFVSGIYPHLAMYNGGGECVTAAGVPSDPYLMTGFDRKRLALSHAAAGIVTVTLELDLTGTGVWRVYDTYRVAPGQPTRVVLDDARAYWLRVTADCACTATAWLTYE